MKTRKILSAFLVCVMVVCAMSTVAFAGEIDAWDGKSYSIEWCKAEHTSAGSASGQTYYIETAEDLAGLSYLINTWYDTTGDNTWDPYKSNNAFQGDTVILNTDINLAGYDWAPIGWNIFVSDKNAFRGNFDGNGHTIYNLNVPAEKYNYAGLFGKVATQNFTQTFKNITIENATVNSAKNTTKAGKEGAGALIGDSYGSTIINCHVKGNINIYSYNYAGGLVGQSRSNISDSTVEATGVIESENTCAGGLVGYLIPHTNNGGLAAINDCSVAGENGLTVKSDDEYAGGLIGYVSSTNSDTLVVDEVSVSNLTVEAAYSESGDSVASVAQNFKATNATVENVGTYVAGEETIPSDSENVTPPAAKVNGVEYDSVQEAIDAAKSGDTVEIYAGEYSPINISNKNITIKGTVGDNGELLTTIKGGNPAITGHSFNGTIKDIKIVDAWKVMYAEPAGNVTVDNAYVTGATYGFHLVAYSPDLTWTIQNSYMDLSWANSFGVYGEGYSDIIIRGNTFEATNPYYPDYGAIHVNSFLPSVTVEENIFGENAKIYIDASVTDTSKINISKNYHADGVENAFADDAEGVTVPIYQYYTEVDEDGNLSGLVEIPSFDGVNINSLDDLKAFRDSVNEGNTYKGKTVVLNVDINLEGENWTPIGTQTNAFQGTFDGGKHTISNLTIDNEELSWAGLFGYAKNAKINNVNIKNVDIHAYSQVGAIAGTVYTGSVSNCHVSGTIKLVADYAYAGGITSEGYVTVSDSSVIADGMGEITVKEKSMAGGITGWRGEGKNDILNCTVKNLNITAYSAVGAITGLVHYENTIDGCTVDNVNLYKTRVNGQASIGLAAGNWSNKADDNYTITITNNSFDNISINGTAINSLRQLYGSNYSYYDKEIKLVESGNTYGNITTDFKVVAGSADDLEKAFAYADDGDTITLLSDIELKGAISTDKSITIDGNNHKITSAANFVANGNSAALVFADGKVDYNSNINCAVKNVTFEGFNGLARVVRANFCNVTIENCVFVNNNVTSGVITSAYAVLNVEDCEFNNNTTDFAVVNIGFDVSAGTELEANLTGNTFTGNKAAIAIVYLASSANVTDNYFSGNIHTGTNDNAAAILAGPYTGNMEYTINVTGNAFANAMSKDKTALPAVFAEDWSSLGSTTAFDLNSNYWNGGEPDYGVSGEPEITLENYYTTYEDGKLSGLVDISAVPVAQIGDTKYTSLADALNAAVATKGGNVTVEILDDIDLTAKTWTPVYFDSYSAANANTIVIEGNNKTITGLSDMMFSGVWTGDKLEIRNLTLDNARIVNDAADTENKGVGAFVGNVSAVKELVITNCHLTNSHVEGGHWTGGFVGYAAGYSGNDGPVFTEITVENCSVENSTITGKGSVGGIVGHATGDAWTTFDVETTEITGNTITSTGSSANKAGIVMGTIGAAGTGTTVNGVTKTGGVKVAVVENDNTATSNGIAITTVYGRQGTSTGVLTITGGTYENNPIEENATYAAPAEGFEIVKNENGTYGVVEKVETPVLPEATVTKLGAITVDEYKVYNGSFVEGGEPIDLQIAMQFISQDTAETAKENYYAGYTTDFFIKIEGMSGESFVGDGCYLAGYYDFFGSWVKVPLDGMTIENGVVYPVLSSIKGLNFTYADICELVKDFKCGIYLTEDVLVANPNLNLTLSLGLSETPEQAQAGNFINVDEVTYVKDDFVEEKLNTNSSYIRNIETTNANGDARYQVILFAGIDSLKYKEVGFEITVDGDTREQATNVVYTSYIAAGVRYTPDMWGEGCEYIFALPINFQTTFKDKSVTYRPFAIKLDGNTIYGEAKTIDKIYNK